MSDVRTDASIAMPQNEYGIIAIRDPRRAPHSLSEALKRGHVNEA